MSSAGRDALVAMLSRLKGDLTGLNLSRPEMARQALATKHALTGDYLTEVLRLCQRGIEAGWLCDMEMHGGRYSRLAPPSKFFPFAIDAMQLAGDSASHAHGKGEVNLTFALAGTPRFCGQDLGWSVFGPGSKHAHEARSGVVLVLSFAPSGATKWDAFKPKARPKAVSAPAKTAARRATVDPVRRSARATSAARS